MPEPTSSSPSKPKPTLRPATPLDAPSIASLGSHIFRTTFGYSLPPSDLETYLSTSYSPTSITSDILNPSMTTLVAISPSSIDGVDKIVGFVQLNRSSTEPCIEGSSKPVELQRLYVDTTFQGGGVGRLLVEAIEGFARKEGYETLWLGVWEENLKALGFYGRCGFVECGGHDFKMGECVQRDLIVKKTL